MVRIRSTRERGSMTAELVILAPVFALFVMMCIGLGRYELVRMQVVDAARAGADAASVVASPGEASGAAQSAAVAPLQGEQHACPDPTVAADTADFVPGGSVAVSVHCTVSFSDLLVPGLPGTVTISSTQRDPVDPYRVVQ